jgi:hypothetical protein
MEQIRRMIDEDPYEALFGRSNRLGRFGKRDWPFDFPRWWQKELEYLKDSPIFKGEDFPKKVQVRHEQSAPSVKDEVNARTSDIPSSYGGVPPSHQENSSPISHESLNEEVSLEYDPISNRMVPKGDKTFSHYGQELDAAVEIPVKPYRPSEPAEDPSPIPRQTPTFTMLKEEPVESQPSPTEAVRTNQPTSTDVRAEYERYKAQRLPEPSFSRDNWLINEGFASKLLAKAPSNNQAEPHKTPAVKTDRAELGQKFDQVHSPEKEIAQDILLGNKSHHGQESNDANISRLENKVNEMRQHRDVQRKSEVLARKDLTEHELHLLADNQKNGKSWKVKDTKFFELQEKVNEISARREILEYNMRVAKENLTREEAKAAVARMDKFVHGVPILEPLWKAISPNILEDGDAGSDRKASRETSLQRHANNAETKASTLQTAMERHNKTTREAIDTSSNTALDQAPRTHDPNGYNHGRESKRSDVYIAKPIETSTKAQQGPRDAEAMQNSSADSISSKAVGFESEKATQRAHLRSRIAEAEARIIESQQRLMSLKPVSVNPEAGKPGQQGEAGTPIKPSDIFKSSIRRVPSLAEIHGYKKDDAAPSTNSGAVDMSKIQAQVGLLNKEVESQKYAMRAIEEKRNTTPSPEATASSILAEQKPMSPIENREDRQEQDVQLVRQIRNIYESRYGQITTKHRQEGVDVTPESKPSSKLTTPETKDETALLTHSSKLVLPSPSPEPTLSEPVPAEPTFSEPISAEPITAEPTPSEPVAPKPSHSDSIPQETTSTESVPATYMVLAYDNQTQRVTTATLSSPPANTLETPIPLTVALRGLNAPAKFLPHLSTMRVSGFTPIWAEKNLLILKHVGGAPVPTDGVNHATTTEDVSSDPQNVTNKSRPSTSNSAGVNKLEPVFSGRNFTRTKEEWSRLWWENRERRRMRRRRMRRALKTAALIGGVGVATLYAAGVMAEMKKVTVHDRREG